MSICRGASSALLCVEDAGELESLRSGTARCSGGLVALESRRFLPNNPLRFFSLSGALVLPELLVVLPVLGLDSGLGRKAVGPNPPGTEYHVANVESSKGM